MQLVEFGTNPYPWMAMELMEGGDLRERMWKGPIAIHEGLDIAGKLCGASIWAHNAGILHRDIKPENVLFTKDGVPKRFCLRTSDSGH